MTPLHPYKYVSAMVFSTDGNSFFSLIPHLIPPQILVALLSKYIQILNTSHHSNMATLGQVTMSSCLDYYHVVPLWCPCPRDHV